jgi:DNA-binding response OmpR family regulator
MATHKREALVVEDDQGESELAALVLCEFDLRVTRIPSGEAALDHLLARSEQVGVVVISVDLAGDMDGIGLARRISVLWPGLSILVTSANRGVTRRALPPRATLIPKPWLPLDMIVAADRAARADHSIRAVPV